MTINDRIDEIREKYIELLQSSDYNTIINKTYKLDKDTVLKVSILTLSDTKILNLALFLSHHGICLEDIKLDRRTQEMEKKLYICRGYWNVASQKALNRINAFTQYYLCKINYTKSIIKPKDWRQYRYRMEYMHGYKYFVLDQWKNAIYYLRHIKSNITLHIEGAIPEEVCTFLE